MKVKVLNTETQIEVREMNLDDWIDQSGECSLGRSPYSGLVLDSPDVSRLHAKFAFESGHYYFYDLGSSNGSMLNGQVVAPQQKQLLKPGDIIRVGEFMLTLYPSNNRSESLAATVIGGAEMTVLGQLSLPELNVAPPPLEVAEPLKNSFSNQQSEHTEPEVEVEAQSAVEKVPLSNTFSLSNPRSEEAVVVDVSVSNDLYSNETEQQPDVQSSNLNSESDFTVIQLEPSVDLSESSEVDSPQVKILPEVLPKAEIMSEETVDEQPDSSFLEEDTYTPSDYPAEALTFIQLDQHTEAHADATLELSHLESNLIFDSIGESQETVVADEAEVSDTHIPKSLLQSSDNLEEDAVSIQSNNTLNAAEEDEKTRKEVNFELEPSVSSLTTALDVDVFPSEATNTEVEPADDVHEDSFKNAEKLEAKTTEATESDAHVLPPTEQQPAPEEKYVALLAHDSQSSALAELVANHKAFLTHCLTIATPSISEVLKQQVGFEVSCQTPSMPVGGYQTINSLIASDKVSAVIFLRDFLDSQANSVNDEAFSRSCNIHQVLFASNFSTAGVLMQYLQNVMTKQ